MTFEVTDLEGALLQRDSDERPELLAAVTGANEGFGPGLCSYDSGSETGMLLVTVPWDQSADPFDIPFKLHATGVHP